ncbi:MAG: hypothetical protein AAF694_12680 [Bacteroidota bacterium]
MGYQKKLDKYEFNLQLSHDNILNTSRQRDQFVQAFIHASLWQHYQLSPKLKVSSWIEYDHFLTNNNLRLSTYAGISYSPFPELSLTPLIGFSWDQRNMILDKGFSPALLLSSQYTWEDGLNMETRIFARTKYISPRNQRNLSLHSIWTRSFSSYADLAFQFHGGSSEIDDYRSNMIERILSDTLNPRLSLRYQFRPQLFWDSENAISLTQRQFKFDVFESQPVSRNDLSFSQFDIFSRQKLSFGGKKFRGYFLYEYQSLNRRYELENTLELTVNAFEQQLTREKQKDFLREINKLEIQVNYQLHPRHALKLIANNRYLTYDTPSESNFDDHDELNYGLNTEWRAQWSRRFSTAYRLLGNVRKYAFLFQERSQDNYTQYSLRMEFDYRWEPLKKLRIKGSQYVYVAYNIKDFEDFNRTDRSTRNLESHLNIKSQPHKNWDIDLTLYRRETHVSYIDWESFNETTLDTTITYNISHIHTLQIKSPWENIRLFMELGYQHLSLSRKFNTSMTNLNNILVPINLRSRSLQTGPRTGFNVYRRNPASIQLNVWWQLQYQDNIFQEIDAFTSLSASFREEALRRIGRNFRPFFTLKLNFWLP